MRMLARHALNSSQPRGAAAEFYCYRTLNPLTLGELYAVGDARTFEAAKTRELRRLRETERR